MTDDESADIEREKTASFELGRISRLKEIADELRSQAGDIYAEADHRAEIDKAKQLKKLAREYEDRAEDEREQWDTEYGEVDA